MSFFSGITDRIFGTGQGSYRVTQQQLSSSMQAYQQKLQRDRLELQFEIPASTQKIDDLRGKVVQNPQTIIAVKTIPSVFSAPRSE